MQLNGACSKQSKPLDLGWFPCGHTGKQSSMDAGEAGVEDRLPGLENTVSLFTGAGMDIAQARRPVIIERDGARFVSLNLQLCWT